MSSELKLNAELLAAIESTILTAQSAVEGFLQGLHQSPFIGSSSEFASYRPYAQGDNLRHIDWKVWGRTDKFYLKQFEDETNLRCQLFVDASGSMDFGSPNKFGCGCQLAAALAYLMARQQDESGLVLFGGEKSRVISTSRGSRRSAEEIHVQLALAKAGGTTAVDSHLLALIQSITRRGLAVVISDFLSPGAPALEIVRSLFHQRQEIIVFHLVAPEEMNPPIAANASFEDVETGECINVDPATFRKIYQENFGQFLLDMEKSCQSLEADYVRLQTDQSLGLALAGYLEKRERAA